MLVGNTEVHGEDLLKNYLKCSVITGTEGASGLLVLRTRSALRKPILWQSLYSNLRLIDEPSTTLYFMAYARKNAR